MVGARPAARVLRPSAQHAGARGQPWLRALRVRTLPAGAAPVLVGLGLAAGQGFLNPALAAATLGSALLIQVGTNLANDYYDHLKGVDRADRLGPPRVTGAALAPARVQAAMLGALGGAALLGLSLVVAGGWPILVIGGAALVCALAYAGGPRPLGHLGLGDAFVFVFFGPVAVAGTYYLQAGSFPPEAWLAGVGPGALSTAILVVNNVRDRATDARAGKRTLAVRLGARASWAEYAVLVGAAYAVPVALWLVFRAPASALLPLGTLPLALLLVRDAPRREGAALNEVLARTALLLALYGALFAVGVAG